MKIVVAWALLTLPLWAGQSLRLNGSQTASNTSVAAQGANSPCRLEFQLTFTTNPTDGHPASFDACGGDFYFTVQRFQIYFNRTTGSIGYHQTPTSLFNSNWALGRIQLIPSGAGGTMTWEMWDINGVLVDSASETYTGTSGSNSKGASVGSTGSQDSSWGFFRLYTTTVSLGSREPTFADNGNLLEWKFNTTLSDVSGRGYTATSSARSPANPCGSAPCYEATSGQTLVKAVIRAIPAPSWGNPTSWRAGTTVGLDGSASISMGDSGGTPAMVWQILSGPSTPVWSSHTATQPSLTGIVFGNYRVQLVATDSNGGSATATADIGAVAQDSSGIVVNADPNADKIFGPMIAFGKNPWGWMDERAYSDVALQQTYLTNSDYNPPPFTTKGVGTIAYKYGGNIGCTTLSAGITATDTAIPVTNASCLDLSTLPTTPTDIMIGTELVRICSTSATSGAATLTVCYDGRGAARGSYTYGISSTQVAAAIHSNGAAVGDQMTTGTSTLFVTDSNRALCPGGAPGFPGPVQYSTGTLTMTASSAVVTGSGTTWNTGNLVFAGQMIRIAATHGGGTAFTFLAVINSVDSTTQLTLSRPAPSDIDASAFSYQIIGATSSQGGGAYYGAWEIQVPGTSPAVYTNVIENVQLCESETRASTARYFDAGSMLGTTQTGVHYSRKTQINVATGFSVNFYGSGLAMRAFNQRSGYALPLTIANAIDDYWVNDPEVCAGYCQGGDAGYTTMGGIIGGIADKVLNPSTPLSWDNLREFGNKASSLVTRGNFGNCNSSDARTVGAAEAIVSLLALFDTAQQSHWNGILYSNSDSFYAWDQTCKDVAQVNSWSNNGGTFNATSGPTVTLTNGSTSILATSGTIANGGSAVNSCTGGSSTGTATVTAGSDILTKVTGTFASGIGVQIVLDGTRLGSPYTLITDFRNDSSTQDTLGGKWPADADSGTVNWSLVTSPWYTTSFGANQADTTRTLQNFVCTYVDSTHGMLNRLWPFTTGTYHMFTYNIPGTLQQPFMLGGIKNLGIGWAAQNSDPTIAAAFNTEYQQIGTWMHDTGFDPYALGPFYARINQLYEPVIVPSSNYTASWITSTVASGTDINSVISLRELTGEAATSLRSYYASQGSSSAAKTWGDQQYGALWSRTGYDTGGVFEDSKSAGNNIGASNLTDTYLGSSKWSGFFFGLGMAHQWPAVRLGGVAPAVPRTLSVGCNISSVTNATKCRVTLTKPDGSTVTNTCTMNPCSVTADARQGEHLRKVEYLSASDAVLTAGEPEPVRVN